MHPNERPDRFLVGGHRLSYEMLGIDGGLESAGVYSYPEGYHPWSIPALYDTALPGRGNTGHAFQFEGLTEADKRALIEYLKLL